MHAPGLPCSGPEEPVTVKRFQEYRPGLVAWFERHALLTGGAVSVVLLVAVVAGVLAGSTATAG